MVYLNFRCAFDSIPHEKRLVKLATYGIQRGILAWIYNFLTDRVQRVVVNGVASPWIPIPQGSMLGPTLFVAFINDLPSEMQARAQILADDTKIYGLKCDTADKEALQADPDRLDAWLTDGNSLSMSQNVRSSISAGVILVPGTQCEELNSRVQLQKRIFEWLLMTS